MMSASQARQLRSLVASRKNIVIAGGTGSGKTTLAIALLDEIKDERLLIIEDTPEITLNNLNTLYWLTTHVFSARDAVKTALRVRPDRIILGECRDGAALDWLKAAQTGHPGSLCTIHASSAEGAYERLRQLVQEVVDNPSDEQIYPAVDYVVFIARKGKKRTVQSILSTQAFLQGKRTKEI